MAFQSAVEKALFEADQIERRAQFFRDAALLHAVQGNGEKAKEMFQLYAQYTFPELTDMQAQRDAMAESILKRLPESIPVFPSGGVTFTPLDALRQHKVHGAGLNEDPIPERKIGLKK